MILHYKDIRCLFGFHKMIFYSKFFNQWYLKGEYDEYDEERACCVRCGYKPKKNQMSPNAKDER